MNSAIPKVLHRVGGVPMIASVLEAAQALMPTSITVVVGHRAQLVREALIARSGLTFVVQEPQLGTAHALLTTAPLLAAKQGTLVLLSGDVPLLTGKTLERLVSTHVDSHAAATIITATLARPEGYGRIVRNGRDIARIVEDKDASPIERQISEINAGIYAFELEGLFDALGGIAPQNAQAEYYLPDLVAIFRGRDLVVETVEVSNTSEILGINSRAELAMVNDTLKRAKNAALMASGVTIEDPATTYIDADVEVGIDTVIHPGVALEQGTIVGGACEIHSGSRLVRATLGDRVTVLNHCVISDSTIDSDAAVGPFAHLRGHAEVGRRARVGNFVELKKTVLGPGSKSMHLTYLGDAIVGANVNIGAGTITCNYDGSSKHTTTIEDGAFVGSDTQLVAPVTIGEGAYVGTGTTIRSSVPPGALAISAGPQRNIEGWVEARKKKRE